MILVRHRTGPLKPRHAVMNGYQIVEYARQKIGQPYRYGARVPLDDFNWSQGWDCAELCSWAVYQAFEIVFGCLDNSVPPSQADAWTGSWKDNASDLGEVIPIENARFTPGAMLLRRSASYGHIVISTGSGNETIEARGQKYGVVAHKIAGRRWDMGILIPGASYEFAHANQSSHLAPRAFVLYFREPKFEGDLVKRIQRILLDLAFYEAQPTGVFDSQTAHAVHKYQVHEGLTPDGEVGKETARHLGVEWSDSHN